MTQYLIHKQLFLPVCVALKFSGTLGHHGFIIFLVFDIHINAVCLKQRLWEDTKMLCMQLDKIGLVYGKALAQANL